MTSTTTAVADLPTIDHDQAMRLAELELRRVLELVDELTPEELSQATDCTEWDVRALLGHLLGMLELTADPAEARRQREAVAAIPAEPGRIPLDALTGLQVMEHAQLTSAELVQALHSAAARSLAARRATTAEQRAAPFVPLIPGEGPWTIGHLLDVIHTRDPWIHRVDITRATGRELVLTPDHDGRIVAGAVEEWALRHGRPFRLLLDGPAGGSFASGDGGPDLRLDAVEFCRMLSGRSRGDGLLATRVPF